MVPLRLTIATLFKSFYKCFVISHDTTIATIKKEYCKKSMKYSEVTSTICLDILYAMLKGITTNRERFQTTIKFVRIFCSSLIY